MKQIGKGIWKMTIGEPEEHTPEYFREFDIKSNEIDQIPISQNMKLKEDEIQCKTTARGLTITLPMDTKEDIYGFGLQLKSLNQAGKRRFIKINSDPIADTGEGHASVPFYISTAGYGLFVNTFRYATFHMGTNTDKGASGHMTSENIVHKEFSESALYALKRSKEERKVIIDIPYVKGIELYFFEGNVMEVVRRYTLYSGGGCVPPMWGLGMWYRSYGGSKQDDIIRVAEEFRAENMPIDVLGLEPGWHSHSYSCSYKWSDMFPKPEEMIEELKEKGYKLNLWEHLFVYPTAPFYKELLPYSGDYEVWNGLVPDLSLPKARNIFEDYHYENFVQKGIMGFKLDECDGSDYNPSNWSFPDASSFPSGMDGEQMHMAVGTLFQNAIYNIFKKENKRTYSQVRSSGALAAPLPFVLYSDLYNHKDFIRGVVTSGFSGLLWCPEVRNCADGNDLLRRIETIVFSAHALINSWRIPNPPWKQVDIKKNLNGEFMEDADYYTEECRKYFNLRMQLLPYLYSAFIKYHRQGVPPVRALVMDFWEDEKVRMIDSQYMFGDSMMVCPLVYEEGTSRKVYLPEGKWYHFFTKEVYEGGMEYEIEAKYNEIPVFVREGAIIPLAKEVLSVDKDTVFEIEVHLFGEGDGEFVLYEDDFESFDYQEGFSYVKLIKEQNQLKIEKVGDGPVRFHITGEKIWRVSK